MPFGLRILDLDLRPLHPTDIDFQGLLKSSLFLISLATLGGFSGYRILCGLGKHILDKILKEKTEAIEEKQGEIVEKTSTLERETHELKQDYLNQQRELLLYKAKCNYTDGLYNEALENIRDFFSIAKQSETPPADLTFAFIQRGRAYKKLRKYDDAINSVNEGLQVIQESKELKERSPHSKRPPVRHHGVLLFNRACYRALLDAKSSDSSAIDTITSDLRAASELIPLTHEDLLKEEDLSSVIAHSKLTELITQLRPASPA